MRKRKFLENFSFGEKIARILKFWLLYFSGMDTIAALICFILMFFMYYVLDFNEPEKISDLMAILRPIFLWVFCSMVSFEDGERDTLNNRYSLRDRIILAFVFLIEKIISLCITPDINSYFMRELATSTIIFYHIIVVPCLIIPYYLGHKLSAAANPQLMDMFLRDENDLIIKEKKEAETPSRKTGTWRDSINNKE
ncbi:MAG: hypothetical protein J6D42_09245 [Clostridia bacterium]|nr:hypothetical protein [Clostridia bacterium]MBQ2720392.1 hypothetical protein [Clostridia bacterium]